MFVVGISANVCVCLCTRERERESKCVCASAYAGVAFDLFEELGLAARADVDTTVQIHVFQRYFYTKTSPILYTSHTHKTQEARNKTHT